MTPRAEFVLLATVAGALVSVLGYLVASAVVFGTGAAGAMRTALLWSPAGALAAAGGAWSGSGWQRRAQRAGRRWGALGLAMRSAVLAVLAYTLLAAAWVVFTAWLDHRFAASGAPLGELWNWLPSIILVASTMALLLGALPALLIYLALGRRYLRRLGGQDPETA